LLTVIQLRCCYDLLSFMAERDKHPEIDIQTPVRALIGLEPVQTLPETNPEEVLDIPSLIRLFQTDAYPLPESAPLQIAVGKETSLTLYPKDEALEYRQQTPEHTIYLRASKAGELAFSFTPTSPVRVDQEPSPIPPENSVPETVPVSEEALLPEPTHPVVPAQHSENPTPAKDQARVASDATRGKDPKERKVITGRVGRVPTVKQIKTGLMAKFPVGEHHPDGSTTWHTVVAFGKTAEALKDSLTKGQLITVGGYPHEREITGKAGQTRTVTEIYLAGLKHHKLTGHVLALIVWKNWSIPFLRLNHVKWSLA
jgi:single-strand DNA-binding protein